MPLSKIGQEFIELLVRLSVVLTIFKSENFLETFAILAEYSLASWLIQQLSWEQLEKFWLGQIKKFKIPTSSSIIMFANRTGISLLRNRKDFSTPFPSAPWSRKWERDTEVGVNLE